VAATLDDIRSRLDRALRPPAGDGPEAAPVLADIKARLAARGAGGVSPTLVDALIQVESGGDPSAVSDAGASGLGQIMPETGRDPGFNVAPIEDRGDPIENRRFASDYLKAMLRRYGGDERLALAAYNMGPGAVDTLAAQGGDLPAQVERYVANVKTMRDRLAANGPPDNVVPMTPAGGTTPLPSIDGIRRRLATARRSDAPARPMPPAPRRKPDVPGVTPAPYAPIPEPINPLAAARPGLARSSVNAIFQGAAGGVAGLPESVGIGHQENLRFLQAQYDAIDRGEIPKTAGATATMALVSIYRNGDAETRNRMRAEIEPSIGPVANEPAYRAGQAIRDTAADAFPVNPEHASRFPVQLGQGLGSTAAFLATGAAGRVLRLPAMAVTAGTGALTNAADTFRDAMSHGATFEDAARASKLSGVVGLSESLPIARVFDRFDKGSGGTLRRIITEGLKGGAEEGAQELFQSVADNLVASKIVAYDPKRGIFRGTGDNAGVGFTVGALFSTLAGMLGVKLRARPRDITEQMAKVALQDEAAPTPATETPADARPVAAGEQIDPRTVPTASAPETATPASSETLSPRGPEVFTSTATTRPELPAASGVPRRVKIPPTAGTATPETDEIIGPDGAVRVEQLRDFRSRPKFRAVSRSIESYLDQADRRRNKRTLTADRRKMAAEARVSNVATFAAAETALARMLENGGPPGSGAGVIVETLTARGKRTTFEFPATAGGLGTLRGTRARYEKLPAQTTGYGMQAPEAGTAEAPIEVHRAADIAAAGRQVDTAPSEAEIAAGNYAKAHVRVHGLDITIENPKGSVRTGSARRGRRWKVKMPAAYGFIKRTEGADGDQVDVYLGDHPTSERIFVVAQKDLRTGKFDESKVMLGFPNVTAARRTYVAGFSDGKGSKRVQSITPYTVDAFRAALDRGEFKKRPTVSGEPRHMAAGKRASAGPGAAHVGLVRDQVAGVAAEAGKPLRREDILRPLLTDLGASLYQGRIKSKRFLGFYRRRIEEVRIKKMADIEVAAHELAHLLDDRIPEIGKQWHPATKANAAIRDELRGVSYDKSKLFEGFAEYVRLWATQKERARAAAPRFTAWFEKFLDRSRHGPALRKAQGEMHQWFAQDAVTRARSKIGKAGDINAGVNGVWDKFRQAVSDDLHGIYQMERSLTGRTAPGGAYETARLTRAKSSITEGALLYGAPVVHPDGSHTFEGKGLKQILDPVADRLDDALMYFVGRSAGELMGQGREHLFTKAEIKGMRDLETAEFAQAFDEYQSWNRRILDFAQAKGVINPAARALWKRTQYLPFHRVGQPGAFSAVPGDWRGIKALTGGTDNLRDVLGNMIGNAAMLIDAGLTNEARLEVARLAGERGGGRFLVRIPNAEKIVKVHAAEIERAILDALGVEKLSQIDPVRRAFVERIVAGMGGMVPLLQRGQTPLGRNVVAVLRGGKPDYYEVADPVLYRSLIALRRPAKNWLVRLLSVPKRIGQASITLTFDFLAANIARDTLMGAIMSRYGFRLIVDSAKGMASRITTDQSYRDLIANGGGFASYLVDESAFKTHLEKFYTRKGIDYRTVIDSPSKLLFAVERIADSFEVATRIGEYRRAIARGEHPRHAAYSGREVSTDFAMRGDSQALGFLYDTVIFLKAAVNGMDRLYRGLAHDPNRMAIAARTGLLALLSVALYSLNRGNPLYDDLEDWDKDGHWHIFVPTPEAIRAWADGQPMPALGARYLHFRYPKIWEIGALASLAERSLGRFLDDQPEKLANDTLRIARNVFRVEVIPQAFGPLYELAINRNRFTDRPIETAAMQELQPWARSGPGGNRTLRAMGEAERFLPAEWQASPAQVEALLRGYFNTWALYGLTLSDAAFYDDVPNLRLDQYPVVRRFFQQEPARHTRYVTELYDAIDAATQARRTMRQMDRTWRPDIAGELEQTPENQSYGQLTRADKDMRAISAEMRLIVDTPGLAQIREYATNLGRERRFAEPVAKLRRSPAWRNTGDLKRELLDLWTEQRNETAKRTMQDLEARRPVSLLPAVRQ
jgi:hypothetical protein